MATMRCSACGMQTSGETVVCSRCGLSLSVRAVPTTSMPYKESMVYLVLLLEGPAFPAILLPCRGWNAHLLSQKLDC